VAGLDRDPIVDAAASAQQQPVRVAIVAGTRLYREGLEQILGREPRVEVTGSGATPADGLCLAATTEVVLLDLATVPSPAEVRAFVAAIAPVRVVAFGIPDDEDAAILACAESGVVGYVVRGAGLSELIEGVESAMRDELVCSRRTAATLMRRVATLAGERPPDTAPGRLTSRENEIIALVDAGLSNKEIAGRLHIQAATVKNHLHNIFEKLEVHGRGEAVARLRAHV
jgi:two-component system, NarL family, nitrate/nitrite response regulator NarL